MTPCALIDSVSSASPSEVKSFLGCTGFGATRAISTIARYGPSISLAFAATEGWGEGYAASSMPPTVSSWLAAPGISALRPLPNADRVLDMCGSQRSDFRGGFQIG